jgi:hypothetical protein
MKLKPIFISICTEVDEEIHIIIVLLGCFFFSFGWVQLSFIHFYKRVCVCV